MPAGFSVFPDQTLGLLRNILHVDSSDERIELVGHPPTSELHLTNIAC
jgi:hypothetical protein